MSSASLRSRLIRIAVASTAACAPAPPATSAPGPVASAEPDKQTSAPASAAAPEAAPMASASAAPVPAVTASATPAPKDPRTAAGPDGRTAWRTHGGAEFKRKAQTCGANKRISAACNVPDGDAARIARADKPVDQCPASGMVFSIPCGGCGDTEMPGGGGSLLAAETTTARHRAPSACCYAGCVDAPPKMPPNAGRPLVAGGEWRVSLLVAGASAWA